MPIRRAYEALVRHAQLHGTEEVRCIYPLGIGELQQCFALWKYRDLLLGDGGGKVGRRRQRDFDRAKSAAVAACPEVVAVKLLGSSEALAARKVEAEIRCAARITLLPKTESDFEAEVAALGLASIAMSTGVSGGRLVTKWACGGTLADRLRSPRRVAERELMLWAASLAAALCAVHCAGYSLRGIAPETVVLDAVGLWQDEKSEEICFDALIADLGRAVPNNATQGSRPYTSPIPSSYAPPEGFNGDIASKVDVWCLGCLLWEAATRQSLSTYNPAFSTPISDRPLDQLLLAVPSRFNVNLQRVLQAALEHDPVQRVTAEECFYTLQPDRAARRHSMHALRPHLQRLLDFGDGGYASSVAPLENPSGSPSVDVVNLLNDQCASIDDNNSLISEPKATDEQLSLTIDEEMGHLGSPGRHVVEVEHDAEALSGWKRALDRVRRYRRRLWWSNLPGVKRARLLRRRAAYFAAETKKRRLASSRHCALVVFWSEADVTAFARLAIKSAIDSRVLRLLKIDWQTWRTDFSLVDALESLNDSRRNKKDSRREARKLIRAAATALGDPELDAAAAGAAVELARLDFATQRYCEAVGTCLATISGARLVAAIEHATATAAHALRRGPSSNIALPGDDLAAHLDFVVSSLNASLLRKPLQETVVRAEEFCENDDISTEALTDAIDHQVRLLMLVLYHAYGATFERGAEAREDGAAKLQAAARGGAVRAKMARVWKLAEDLCADELRAHVAATAALKKERKVPSQQNLPRPPVTVVAAVSARHATLELAPSLSELVDAAVSGGGRFSLHGWLSARGDDSQGPTIVLELAMDDDPGTPNQAPLHTRVDDLEPATSYRVMLRLTPLTRYKLHSAATRDDLQSALNAVHEDSRKCDNALVLETLADVPETPDAPTVAVVRLRGTLEIKALVDIALTDGLSSSLWCSEDCITVVKVAWKPPADRGGAIIHYLCERARGNRHCGDPPSSGWRGLKTNHSRLTELLDQPPLHESVVWWYRVTAVNRIGSSLAGRANRIDVTDTIKAYKEVPFLDVKYDRHTQTPTGTHDSVVSSSALGANVSGTQPVLEDLDRGFRAIVADGIYLRTLDIERPLPNSTISSTFR